MSNKITDNMKQLREIALEAIEAYPERGWLLRTKLYAFFNCVKFDTGNKAQMDEVFQVFAEYAKKHNMSSDECAYRAWGYRPDSFRK